MALLQKIAIRFAPKRRIPLFTSRYLSKNSKIVSDLKNDHQQEEYTIIYQKSQHRTIRAILGVSIVNLYAWSAVLFNHFAYGGVVINGIDLSGGDVTYGYVGSAATFALAFFTRYFAQQCVTMAYITKDKKRLGFQVHTMLGTPGKVIEVPIGKAKFTVPLPPPNESKKTIFQSSYIPIKIEGRDGKLLVEVDGFLPPNAKALELLDPSQKTLDDKNSRVKWHKTVRR